MRGLVSPIDAVRVLSNMDPLMQVSYEARKVAGGFIPYTVVNLAISGVLVRLISKLN